MEKFTQKVEWVKIWLAVGLMIFGCLMLIAGFIVDPLGLIDNSVLVAFGEVSAFSGAVLGINYLYSNKHKQLEASIERRLTALNDENKQ